MSIPTLPSLDRTSATFKTDLDTFFLTQLPATTVAFNAEAERLNAIGYGSYNASSTTSLTVGTGSKNLTVETGRGFAVGQALLIASTASPYNYMTGQATSYNSGTGALVVEVDDYSGGGALSAWTVSVSAMTPGQIAVTQRNIASADTLISDDRGKMINASGTFTLSLTAATSLVEGWYCFVRNTANGDVTIDPNASEQIDGANTFVLKPGGSVLLLCTGTAFTLLKDRSRTYSNIASYTASGTFVVPADTYVIRGYAWGRGADGTTTSGGAGGGCAYGDIAVAPGETVTITIASNIATVTTASTARLTANPAVTTTGGTASKHASVTNGGAYAGGSAGAGGGAASGSPLGVGGSAPGYIGGSAWGGFSGTSAGAGIGQGGQYPHGGGSLRTPSNYFTDPLLAPLTGSGGAGFATTFDGVNGGPGAGGGAGNYKGGNGGIGGGGGGAHQAAGTTGGDGGFGGGGAAGSSQGGKGGLGGGGGGSATSGGTGGAACVLIYY